MAEKAIENGTVYNRIACTGLLMEDKRCAGAMGLGVRDGKFYVFRSKATINSMGGAGTLYKSYTADGTDSAHQRVKVLFVDDCVGPKVQVALDALSKRKVSLSR